MELTPIKIRGKKRKAREIYESQLALSRAAEQRNKSEEQRKKRKEARKPITKAMPTLTGIPQEILELIFLYSMNISLPRASPVLGRKLSSHHVKMTYTMMTFFDTVDHRTNYRDRKKTSDPTLQSELLACQFFTYDFFLAYVGKAHDAMVRLRGKAWEKTSVPVPGVEQFDQLWAFKFTKIPYLGFADGFHVPEKLLHGPFTEDKASLLYILVCFSGEIDWVGSMAGETAKRGIKQAIEENNERAVAALSVLLGVPKLITTDLLRHAVINCGCNLNILRHLLFNAQILAASVPKDVLDFHDTTLWAWADKNAEKGGVLKYMLKKADIYVLDFYYEKDADWTKIVSFPYGGNKFDLRAGLNRISKGLLTSLYTHYGRKITGLRRRSMGNIGSSLRQPLNVEAFIE